MGRAVRVIRRTLVSFYDDQMTHHAAALTYYGLMSLFPAVLLGLSLLGLLGEYPRTYNAIIAALRPVVPDDTLNALNNSLRDALRHRGAAAGGLAFGTVIALYGTTGVLEAARRALNVVFEVKAGRSFVHRKLVDIGSSLLIGALVLLTLLFLFVGGDFADRLFALVGLGPNAREAWSIVRWPAAVLVAMFVFAYIYYVTPDVRQRGFRWVTPGAVVGVALWLGASMGFSYYLSNFTNVSAVYGAFAGAIVLIGWLWLTFCALLLGAELDSEIEREKEMSEGVPAAATLNRPPRTSGSRGGPDPGR